jgi:L-ascorbate peroxidase
MVAVTRASLLKTLFAGTLSTSFVSLPQQRNESISEYSKYASAANFVRHEIKSIIKKQDPTLAGPILRLAFHDATVRSIADDPFIGGADGSIRYELDWSENRGLSKPLKVVQEIFDLQKERFTTSDSSTSLSLSFADTLALSGSAAVQAAKGPAIPIKLGRKDVNHADNRFLDKPIESETDRSRISTSLPSAALDSLGLRNYFKRLGLTEEELVALSGAHDLGRHVTLTDMPKACLRNLTRTCLENAPVLTPFISKDPDTLSNNYFENMLRWNNREIKYGEALFIPTDVTMVVDEGLRKYVTEYANDEKLFFARFTRGYQKMVESTATSTWRY